jgi:hypothetical protein
MYYEKKKNLTRFGVPKKDVYRIRSKLDCDLAYDPEDVFVSEVTEKEFNESLENQVF